MADLPAGLKLPANLDDIDPAFMTRVLRHVGVINADNEVVSQQEQDVGMTAGYFSAIKKIACTYARPTQAQSRFVAKTWPPFEIAPKQDIQAMFMKDIKGYQLPAESFFPRPRVYLAACDPAEDRWALIMEDVDSFADHKVHEAELDLSGVLRMIPRMAKVAAAWEGCNTGDKARVLDEVGVEYWASPEKSRPIQGDNAWLRQAIRQADVDAGNQHDWRQALAVLCRRARHMRNVGAPV